VLGYRLRANGLLTRGPLSGALPAGLQDSAPRAGQLSLHARVRGLVQDGWADPSLCQVWGPRGAVYLIAAADRAVFTLGRLPRDTAAADAVLDLTERVVGVLGADEVDPAVVRRALGLGEMPLREVSRSGRLVVRWDTARITVRAVPAPTDGPVAARRELGRRFLAVFGPTDVAAFATWARISRPDAAATWLELADEVTDVTVGGRTRQLLTSRPHWWAEAPAEGVRLLPGDDPVLRLDRELLVPDPARRAVLFPRHAVGALRGALLVDGRVSGWWQRQGGRVGLHPFDRSAPWLPEAVAEARTLPVPGGITVVDVVDA
jgi:Winged helix DNA-binding domain